MIEYNDFELTERQINHIKEINTRKGVEKYIKDNGRGPEDISEFMVISDEDMERYRRMYYSIYLVNFCKSPFSSVNKVCDYLYDTVCPELDYDFAMDYFKKNTITTGGACSSMRSGNYFGRNFDWYYNNDVDFVIHTPKIGKKYASVGISGCNPALTVKSVEEGSFSEALKIFPFLLLDGINEKGVFINDNVVPGNDMSHLTTGTEPSSSKSGDLCMNMLPRFVLDNYPTAKDAIDDIKNHWSVFMKPSELLGHYEVHYMMGDPNETYILEFFDNEMYYEKVGEGEDKLPIMTNFYIKGVNLVDGRIGNVGDNLSGLTPYGSGIDRYNILADKYEEAGINKDKMIEAMSSVWYSNAYDTSKKWYSEFVGSIDRVLDPDGSRLILLDTSTPAEHYEPTFRLIDGMYDNRNRDEGNVWHTTHTSVYDIKNRKLHLRFQENEIEDKEYVFTI